MLTEIAGIKAYVDSTEDDYIYFGYIVDENSDIVIKTTLNTVELTYGEVNLHSYLRVKNSYRFFIECYGKDDVKIYNINGNDRYALMVLGKDLYVLDSWIGKDFGYRMDGNIQVSYIVNCLKMVFKDDIDILINVLRHLGFNVNENIENNILDIGLTSASYTKIKSVKVEI